MLRTESTKIHETDRSCATHRAREAGVTPKGSIPVMQPLNEQLPNSLPMVYAQPMPYNAPPGQVLGIMTAGTANSMSSNSPPECSQKRKVEQPKSRQSKA